jgi:uncharacterized membrane protein YidH (DUF202 family)
MSNIYQMQSIQRCGSENFGRKTRKTGKRNGDGFLFYLPVWMYTTLGIFETDGQNSQCSQRKSHLPGTKIWLAQEIRLLIVIVCILYMYVSDN